MTSYEKLEQKFVKEASLRGIQRKIQRAAGSKAGKIGLIGAASIFGWEAAKQNLADWKTGRRMRKAQENAAYGA